MDQFDFFDEAGKWPKHREIEVYLTTRDGAQHLRLHGWLKRNNTLVKSEVISDNDDYFGNFMIYITKELLVKLKEEHLEKGLYCDLKIVSDQSEKWNPTLRGKEATDKVYDDIKKFMFSFQIKDKKDIEKFVTQANETSLALFKKNKDFINDYVETPAMSYKEKLRDLNLMIRHFEREERYEDCAFLMKIKKELKTNNLKTKIKK